MSNRRSFSDGAVFEADAASAPSSDAQPSRVLLVEDDEICVHLCRRYLSKDGHADYVIESAGTIAEAVAMCQCTSFDCIILDYGLPDGTGVEGIDALRSSIGHEYMPCTIILTGNSDEQAAISAIRSGASDYLTKVALTSSALRRAVTNAIEKNRLAHLHLRRVKELEVSNSLLRKRNEEIQRFYHTVSHEVKTPLTAIKEFVSIVYDGVAGEVQEEQKVILGYALESCEQIKSHFDELLELSRFENGKMNVTMTPSSIYAVFDHCVVAATPAAIEKGITLEVVHPPSLPLVMMQSNRIIQVISNLLNNALKFTPTGGRVKLEAKMVNDDTRLRLSVSDSGCGIALEHQKNIFDRLYQVTPSSDKQNETGLGLGLSIASQIMQLHDSSIHVHSAPGEGSEFWFELHTCGDVSQAA